MPRFIQLFQLAYNSTRNSLLAYVRLRRYNAAT